MKKRILAELLATIVAVSLTACGGGGGSKSTSTYANKAESAMAAESYDYYSDDVYEMAEESVEAPDGSGEISEVNVADSRKIIRNVNMSVETEEFDQFISNIEAKVNNLGGYIESSNINGNSLYTSSGKDRRSANITARIPAKKLDDFVTVIEAKSNVTNKSLSAEDITLSYSDTQEHLNSLKVEQKRIEELILQADDIDTLIALERRLTDIRYEIESYGSRLKTMDNQVDYSTVYLYVSEVVEYTEPEPEELTFGQRITRGLSESFKDLGEGLADFIVGLIVALPYIVVFLFFITIFVFILAKFVQFIIFICSSPQQREENKVKRAERKIKTQERAAALKQKVDEKKAMKKAASNTQDSEENK